MKIVHTKVNVISNILEQVNCSGHVGCAVIKWYWERMHSQLMWAHVNWTPTAQQSKAAKFFCYDHWKPITMATTPLVRKLKEVLHNINNSILIIIVWLDSRNKLPSHVILYKTSRAPTVFCRKSSYPEPWVVLPDHRQGIHSGNTEAVWSQTSVPSPSMKLMICLQPWYMKFVWN